MTFTKKGINWLCNSQSADEKGTDGVILSRNGWCFLKDEMANVCTVLVCGCLGDQVERGFPAGPGFTLTRGTVSRGKG